MTSLYVYAVLAQRPRKQIAGVGVARERLRVGRYGCLFAVVGAVRAVPTVSPRAVRAHDAVVRRVMVSADAVLPVRFGTVFHGRAALARSLAERESALCEALRLVEAREQMTLRVYGDAADVTPGEREIAGAPAHPVGGAGTRYLARRALANHVPALTRLRPFLGALVVAERAERHGKPPLLASAYHLIPRGASDEYRAALARAEPALAPLRVRVSGPWPAYAFTPGPAA